MPDPTLTILAIATVFLGCLLLYLLGCTIFFTTRAVIRFIAPQQGEGPR